MKIYNSFNEIYNTTTKCDVPVFNSLNVDKEYCYFSVYGGGDNVDINYIDYESKSPSFDESGGALLEFYYVKHSVIPSSGASLVEYINDLMSRLGGGREYKCKVVNGTVYVYSDKPFTYREAYKVAKDVDARLEEAASKVKEMEENKKRNINTNKTKEKENENTTTDKKYISDKSVIYK